MIDVDCLGNNKFLKMLYPNGLNSNVMIKEFKVSINGFSEFSFFIKQEPNVIVKKWGIWNSDYNCLWVKTGNNCKFGRIEINELDKMGFNNLSLNKMEDGITKISSKKNSSIFLIDLEVNNRFIIQEIIPIMI